MTTPRLAIVASHPVQYQAAWFRALAALPGLSIEVLYCHSPSEREQAMAGFDVDFSWDIPLLDGYPHRFLRNESKVPSVSTFGGIDTPSIAGALRVGGFDAVLVLGWQHRAYLQAIWGGVRSRLPLLVRSDSHLHTPRSRARTAVKWAPYHWFFRRFAACLPVGTWSGEYFRHYGVPIDRIFTVPHSVDLALISRQASRLECSRDELRAHWGLERTDTAYAFVGKFIPKKRPLDFVRAVELAAARAGNLRGLMVGDGPLWDECRDYVRTHGVPITLAGFLNQSEIVGAYVAADALVLPSDGGETWGLVVNEAMACGRPSFVSDHVGCGPDLVEPGVTGDIFPLGDAEATAATLMAYTAENKTLASMGERARTRAREYTPEVAALATAGAVASALERRGK